MSKLDQYMKVALSEDDYMSWQEQRAYWRNRAEANREASIKTDEAYEKELERIYREALDECTKEIEAFYAKYAEDEGISMAAAKKAVAKVDIDAYARKAKKYVKDKDLSDKANAEMKLYNATMKINRLEMLKSKIGLELVAMSDDLDKTTKEHLLRQTLDEYERQAGILGETVKDSAKHARSIVNADFHNATFSERIWSQQAILRAELGKVIEQSLISGKGIAPLTRQIRDAFGVSEYNAKRLVRTEVKRAQSEATKDNYEALGVEEFEFLAFGSSSCEICQALNGKHFKVKDMLVGENAPPMHPNCRCAVMPWIDEKAYNSWLDSGAAKNDVSFGVFKDLYNEYSSKHKNLGRSERVYYDDDYNVSDNKNELAGADFLTHIFGGQIHCLTNSNLYKEYSPDYEWNGKLWDIKNPEGTNGVYKLVHHGLKQISSNPGGVLVDCSLNGVKLDRAIELAKDRFRRSAHVEGTWLVVIKDNEIHLIVKK